MPQSTEGWCLPPAVEKASTALFRVLEEASRSPPSGFTVIERVFGTGPRPLTVSVFEKASRRHCSPRPFFLAHGPAESPPAREGKSRTPGPIRVLAP